MSTIFTFERSQMHVFSLSITIFWAIVYHTILPISKLQSKVDDAITKWPTGTPKDVAKLRKFLGMITYYSSFIPNLLTLTAPLRELLKKNQAFKLSAAWEAAFLKLEDVITIVSTFWLLTIQVFHYLKPLMLALME